MLHVALRQVWFRIDRKDAHFIHVTLDQFAANDDVIRHGQFDAQLPGPEIRHFCMPVIQTGLNQIFSLSVQFDRRVIDAGSVDFKKLELPGNRQFIVFVT